MTDAERYEAAAHGMQTGVAFMMGRDPYQTDSKHLRVGVNSALVDSGALAQLLISKGVITEGEYLKAIADAMELERDRYQALVNDSLGSDAVKLH